MTPESVALLERHPWPDDVHELQTVLERASLLAAAPVVDVATLLPPPRPAQRSGRGPIGPPRRP